MTIVNKTDHIVALWIDDAWTTIMPYGLSSKLKEEKQLIETKDGVTFRKLIVHGVVELPDKKPDTIYIVEPEVARYVWKQSYREDVCYLDNPVVRDDKYRTLAAMSLVCFQEVLLSYCL
jgi:hypothetical protein